MKTFKKPEFKINKIDELSEPVFMACSGVDLFEMNIDGYQHQGYEQGRDDARFQLNAEYSGQYTTRPYYMFLTFSEKVDVQVPGWEWHVYSDEPGSYTVACYATQPLNHGEHPGEGDFIVTFEDPHVTSAYLLKGWITFDPDGWNCK